MSTFFEHCKCASVMMGTQLILDGKVNASYYDLAISIYRCIERNYMQVVNDVVVNTSQHGKYFPEVFKNPSKYIVP